MNTTDLKLTIMRQVDTLEDESLKEVLTYIQDKLTSQQLNGLDALSEEQKKAIQQAQQSIKEGKGIPHQKIVDKYKTIYGIS